MKMLLTTATIAVLTIVLGCNYLDPIVNGTTTTNTPKGWTRIYSGNNENSKKYFFSPVPNTKSYAQSWSKTGSFTQILTGDVDGDNALEVVALDSSDIQIYDSTGNLKKTYDVSGDSLYSLLDLNGDGTLLLGIHNKDSNTPMRAWLYDDSGNTIISVQRSESPSDRNMYPMFISEDKGVIVGLNAGYSGTPRGFAKFDSNGNQVWEWLSGQSAGYPGNDAYDSTNGWIYNGGFTPHNGVSKNGIEDGNLYVSAIDANDGSNVFTPRKLQDTSQNGWSTSVIADLVSTDNQNPARYILEGHGPTYYHGTEEVHKINPTDGTELTSVSLGSSQGSTMAVFDYEGDGIQELLVVGQEEIYVVEESGGTLGIKQQYSFSDSNTKRLQFTANVDGKGGDEFAVISSETLTVYRNDLTVFQEISSVKYAIPTDIDSDGLLEILVINTNDELEVYSLQ